ncbi:hypothetical protein [Curtobacterium sp. MCBA15_004]|uniref:hypothetical protein n=1 Tax=Curtobacterium sp. MCBA15_004 TaxID=1898733 RepID=UPI0008DDE753|nr:hypothetical protein [Curtobacterium sp. MCBA15_004]WIA97608.1 hypothetical protein QOL16_04230 [Curtobacterium sp. MCBA15_004]
MTWMIRTRWKIPALLQLAAAVFVLLAAIGLTVWAGFANTNAVLAVGLLLIVAAGYFIVDGVTTVERADRRRSREADAAAVASALRQ